jgi:hypothetical protein
MKTSLFLRCMALATAGLMSYSAYSQTIPLPPGFQAQKQTEYNSLPEKEITFADFYQFESAEYQRKQALVLNPSLIYAPGPVRNNTCTNGNFETGLDANQWNGGFGIVNGTGVVQYANFTAGLAPGGYNNFNAHQTLMTAGPDSILLGAIPAVTMSRVAPGGSTQAVRIGNAAVNCGAELLSKTFVVSAASSNISFWYAIVLQNPNDGQHSVAQQPSFRVRVLDNAGVEIAGVVNLGGGTNEAIANAANPFFQSTTYLNQPLVYRDWSCAQIDLSSRVGQTVTVQFVTKDCALTGHFGYAYIDNFCGDCNITGGTNGTIRAGASSGCGDGTICCSFTVPRAPNGTTGFVKPMLHIYQNGALVTTIPGTTFSADGNYCFNVNPNSLGLAPGGFDYTIEGLFNMSTGPLAPITLGNAAIGQGGGQNDDYQVACSRQCCPGTNLIVNGTFEAGNTGFTSGYTYQAPGGLNSVGTGKYSVLTSTEALAVSPTWIAGCADYGRQLIVNGATETTTISKVAWTQTINLRAGTYKFCGDFRNLAQCAFNATPKLSYTITDPLSLRERAIPIDLPGTASCRWTTMESTFTIATDRAVTLTILMSESMTGDGNDIAIDNLSLVALPQVALTDVQFNVNFTNVTGTSYNATATPVTPLSGKCDHFWQVEEVTAAGAVVANTQVVDAPTWSTPNTFKGYNGTSILSGTAAGVFNPNKNYRFIYGRSCPCEALRLYAHMYGPGLAGRAANAPPLLLNSGEYFSPDAGNSTIAKPFKLAGAGDAIRVFPNPTEGNVTLQMAPLAGEATLKVFSSTGQEVKTMKLKEAVTSVDLSLKDMASGVYLLQVTTSNGVMILNERVVRL